MTPLLVALLAPVRVLTLADALKTAEVNQPALRQARAVTEAAEARSDEARAPLLPQLTGIASYQRGTSNFVARPTNNPSTAQTTRQPSWATFDFWNFGLTASALVYDFGQSWGRFRAAGATARAFQASERFQFLQTELLVRTAYFTARARRALAEVARETLTNQERHLRQIQGFVQVGTRPEIDLAQARTDVANTRVQVITSDNNYLTSKAQLNQAMGVEGPTDYDVEDTAFPLLAGEELSTDELLVEALKDRPDVASLELSIRAQELTLSAAKSGYGPSLGVTTSLTDAGIQLDNLVWNWNATVTLSWSLFSGLLTRAQVREQRAILDNFRAQRDALRQQVRLDVDTARLLVSAVKETLVASDEALVNARERLRLAEGRYQTGVGNIIELGDAQLALTNAAAQKVQAEYNLASARAQLVRALGRR